MGEWRNPILQNQSNNYLWRNNKAIKAEKHLREITLKKILTCIECKLV